MHSTVEGWVHSVCLMWIPDVHVTFYPSGALASSNSTPKERIIQLNTIDPARLNLKCHACHLRGACIQCHASKCTRAYHPWCALRMHRTLTATGINSEGFYSMYCNNHHANYLAKDADFLWIKSEKSSELTGGTTRYIVPQTTTAEVKCAQCQSKINANTAALHDIICTKPRFGNTCSGIQCIKCKDFVVIDQIDRHTPNKCGKLKSNSKRRRSSIMESSTKSSKKDRHSLVLGSEAECHMDEDMALINHYPDQAFNASNKFNMNQFWIQLDQEYFHALSVDEKFITSLLVHFTQVSQLKMDLVDSTLLSSASSSFSTFSMTANHFKVMEENPPFSSRDRHWNDMDDVIDIQIAQLAWELEILTEQNQMGLTKLVEQWETEKECSTIKKIVTLKAHDEMKYQSLQAFKTVLRTMELGLIDRSKQNPKTEEGTCAVCFDGQSYEDNAILFCDHCNLAVHQSCYGISIIPKGSFHCDYCRYSQQMNSDTTRLDNDRPSEQNSTEENELLFPQCSICHMTSNGLFKQTHSEKWVHSFCAFWSNTVHISNYHLMAPIYDELPPSNTEESDIGNDQSTITHLLMRPKVSCSSSSSRCIFCNGDSGVIVTCSSNCEESSSCSTSMHLYCGWLNGLYTHIQNETLHMYCVDHTPTGQESSSSGAKYREMQKKIRLQIVSSISPISTSRSALSVLETPKRTTRRHKSAAADDINFDTDLKMLQKQRLQQEQLEQKQKQKEEAAEKKKQQQLEKTMLKEKKRKDMLEKTMLKEKKKRDKSRAKERLKNENLLMKMKWLRSDLESTRTILDLVKRKARFEKREMTKELDVFQLSQRSSIYAEPTKRMKQIFQDFTFNHKMKDCFVETSEITSARAASSKPSKINKVRTKVAAVVDSKKVPAPPKKPAREAQSLQRAERLRARIDTRVNKKQRTDSSNSSPSLLRPRRTIARYHKV